MQAFHEKPRTLIAMDFDGTVANTFSAPSSGIGVCEAYMYAVEETFGLAALEKYVAEGGLRNRAPVEVVRQLAPDATKTEVQTKLAELDAAKLRVLMDQIGPTWPEPLPGYLDFAQRMTVLNQRSGSEPVTEGIISSGHAPFIQRTYEQWGVRAPAFILAQEAIAANAKREGIPLPSKPDTRLMLYAYNCWRALHNQQPTDYIEHEDVQHIRYIGDDMVKDGMLAHHLGIRFHWLTLPKAARVWGRLAFEIEQTQSANYGR